MKRPLTLYLIIYEDEHFVDWDGAVICGDIVEAKDTVKTFNEYEGYTEYDLEVLHKGYFIHSIDEVIM